MDYAPIKFNVIIPEKISPFKVNVSQNIGIPRGGDKGQALIKASNNNYDTKWADAPGVGAINEIDGGFPESVYTEEQRIDGGEV